ncbi:phospholipase D-like domain-containing protein [Micromonospora sagamiensis]|uniref:Uncharacterized protein n=1 Tax=Micromonospora sagamiensis TaxID=47875 RepID=A0A562WKU4_9ACTN|nr:hypothetical protein [Micromonospora sagamiensis]TWJ30919.1 hypothetical protein JD81_04468 [Micromonospora sagamiensis]BCL16042.1 hypothetical protein GCM10017556_37810 [Micromonospora sagamiensis]
MTGTEQKAPAHSRPVVELFTGAATALWATTYSVDLALFNEFLLPRLGEPPLNVVVLADHRRLATALDRLDAGTVDTVAAVNRRWLLRGVRPGGQRFHPKTYLAVTRTRATLLVGSGNLSVDGLSAGREVFTTFHSGTPAGDAAIGAWRGWIRRVAGLVGDMQLADRFHDLEARLPAVTVTATTEIPLLHNLDQSIAAQFVDRVTGQATSAGIDELILTAPYYDRDAAAVGQLLASLRPRRVRVLLTSTTKVDGSRLAARLTASGAAVEVAYYAPDQFVHAKLVGAITGGRGWLLSGSANLSRAGLLHTANDHGNVEMAVLTSLAADEVRARFTPPDTTIEPADLTRLGALSFRVDPESTLPSVRLVSATVAADGTVEVTSEPIPQPGWQLDDLVSPRALVPQPSGSAVTVGPVSGRLVRLVDADGCPLSNRVVVDDVAALAAALTAPTARSRSDRPAELADIDVDSPLVRALVQLNRTFVMEVTERTSAASDTAAAGTEDGQGDDDLWARLERERLARDPRAARYRAGWDGTGLGGSAQVLELLDLLRSRAPGEPAPTDLGRKLLARLLDQATEADSREKGSTRRRWQLAARVRIRARNLLRRWAAAQTDPRLAWIDPLVPADNFAVITAILANLRLHQAEEISPVELTADDLDDLWSRWLTGFVGTGAGDGWLHQLDQDTYRAARQRQPDDLPETVAALCWLLIRPGQHARKRIVAAQPAIVAAVNHDLIGPTNHTARYLSRVVGRRVTRAQVEQDILHAATFVDDALWCNRTADDLALGGLRLKAPPGGAADIQVRLDVRGVDDPLLDPRVPRLVVAVRHYRRCQGVAVFAADADWRLSLYPGETIAFLPGQGRRTIESAGPVTKGDLDQLAVSVGVLADLFPPTDAAES